jgi:hypothetical protein
MKWVDYVNLTEDGEIIYKKINILITVGQLKRFINITGNDPEFIVNYIYSIRISEIRNQKLSKLNL